MIGKIDLPTTTRCSVAYFGSIGKDVIIPPPSLFERHPLSLDDILKEARNISEQIKGRFVGYGTDMSYKVESAEPMLLTHYIPAMQEARERGDPYNRLYSNKVLLDTQIKVHGNEENAEMRRERIVADIYEHGQPSDYNIEVQATNGYSRPHKRLFIPFEKTDNDESDIYFKIRIPKGDPTLTLIGHMDKEHKAIILDATNESFRAKWYSAVIVPIVLDLAK